MLLPVTAFEFTEGVITRSWPYVFVIFIIATAENMTSSGRTKLLLMQLGYPLGFASMILNRMKSCPKEIAIEEFELSVIFR